MRNSPILAALLVLSACSHASTPKALERPTTSVTSSSTTSPATTTSAPTTAPAVRPPVAAGPTGCTVPPRAQPAPDRPRYQLHLDVQPQNDLVTGDLTVVFTPDLPTDHLVFRLWPNGPRTAPYGADLQPGEMTVDGSPPAGAPTRPNPTTMVVPLGHMAPPGGAITVIMTWKLHLARPVDDRYTHAGDGIRMGSFFPILPWEPGVGWDVEPPTSAYAESSTAPAADFDVTVTVPFGYSVLASGEADTAKPGHFVATGMRDIAISIGHFRIATGVARGPQPVPVIVGVAADINESPQPYLDKIVKVIAAHSARFGAYPWPAFTMAVTGSLKGGIEYPGHVMQGPGTLGRTTSHELGHQWFYALVGNDQGRDPWLDEGLASWAEARYENVLPSFVNRVIPADARGHVGDPMTFWESHRSSYYAGVYVQGTQALAAVSSPAAVDCALAHYVARNAYRIAKPRDLIDALKLAAPDASARMARFGVKA